MSDQHQSGRVLRDATAADYEHFVRLVPELGVDDPIAPEERWIAEMMGGTLMVEEDGVVAGYVYWKRLAEDAYIFHLVVAPTTRKRGLGRALMLEVASRAARAGARRWQLNVKVDNTPAIALYRALGFTAAYESTPMKLRWEIVPSLQEPVAELEARVVGPSEDEAIERAFGVPNGRIAEKREKAGWVVLRLVDRAHPEEPRVGLACFNPAFPGAFPFHVAHPSYARALLLAMKPYALPQHDAVGIVVEADPGLKQAMVEAGAEIRYELFHMKGPIPEAG